jgi:hypothetical protein
MHWGKLILVTSTVLACTACLGEGGKLEIRSAGTGLKTGDAPVPFRIAEARGHLALGNVALALEGFRKAAREDPASVDALAGIALCYDQMERFDLSRRHYEMALAIAPRDAALLAAFADSLDRQGMRAEAASVRREMAALATPPSPAVALAENIPAPIAPTVAAPVGQSVTIALPPPRPAGSVRQAPVESRAMTVAPVGQSVTIALPPPRPVAVAKAVNQPSRALAEAHRQPRIERLSLTEVALVTGSGPRWVRPIAPPVRTAMRRAPVDALAVRVLNAARVERLAARTRTYLGRFGWRDVAVGDAASVRAHSLIVYPHGTRTAATRLSNRLGFAMAERQNVRQVTILLGRDAAGHPGLRPTA